MGDKPNLIQTVATIASMCDMDSSDSVKDEMFEFVASAIHTLEAHNKVLTEALEEVLKIYSSNEHLNSLHHLMFEVANKALTTKPLPDKED